jgi:spermidine/putrescine transport system permease protein
MMASLWTSFVVAGWVTLLAVAAGTANAFLIERTKIRGKAALSLLMLAPPVIPGVILGISILAFASRIANLVDDLWGIELEFLRPGLPLVVLGQLSFVIAIATLTITARLKRFGTTLEEAAYNLGASRAAAFTTITLPYLKPALIGAAAISFLMSIENFNTTLMLVGSDAPLTVMMYGRMREGATPVLTAVSLSLMVASAVLALTMLRGPRVGEGQRALKRRLPASGAVLDGGLRVVCRKACCGQLLSPAVPARTTQTDLKHSRSAAECLLPPRADVACLANSLSAVLTKLLSTWVTALEYQGHSGLRDFGAGCDIVNGHGPAIWGRLIHREKP